jgi:hypothetical protein
MRSAEVWASAPHPAIALHVSTGSLPQMGIAGSRFRAMRRRVIEASNYSFANNVALQLGHGAGDREHRLAHGRRRVQRFLVGDEANTENPELGQGRYKLLDARRSKAHAVSGPPLRTRIRGRDEDHPYGHARLAGPGGAR